MGYTSLGIDKVIIDKICKANNKKSIFDNLKENKINYIVLEGLDIIDEYESAPNKHNRYYYLEAEMDIHLCFCFWKNKNELKCSIRKF